MCEFVRISLGVSSMYFFFLNIFYESRLFSTLHKFNMEPSSIDIHGFICICFIIKIKCTLMDYKSNISPIQHLHNNCFYYFLYRFSYTFVNQISWDKSNSYVMSSSNFITNHYNIHVLLPINCLVNIVP